MSETDLDVDNSKNGNSISGKVTMDGKPLPYAMVFLKENKYKYMMGSILGAGDGVIAIAITDEQGMYNINNIPDGLYGIGISADWHRINEENEQIYYDYFRYGNIVAFPYILDVEKERVNGFYTSFSYSDKGVDPYTIIEAFYHTGDYAYTIYAHDEKENQAKTWFTSTLRPSKIID